MKGSKKLLVLLAIGLALVMIMTGFLGACSSTPVTTTATATTTQTSTATTTAVTTKTTTTTSVKPAPIKLVVSMADPPTGGWPEVYDPFYKAVTQRTDGGVTFEVHYNGELAGFFEAYDAVAQGTVDMAQGMTSMYPNIFPLEDVAAIVWYDVKCLARSQMYTELGTSIPEFNAPYEKSGTKLIWRTATFPNQSCMRKGVVVKTVDDFKGKKYLSTGPWDAATWTALGMTPMSMMPTETFLNLQTGVVDGATLTLGSLFDFGWGEVAPNITDTNVRPGSFQMFMNLKKWNSISAEYQKIIMEEAAKVPVVMDAQQNRFDRELRPVATQKYGTTFYTFTMADFLKMNDITAPVKVKFAADLDAKGLPGTKILNAAKTLEIKYSDPKYALK
jgi:TRAP-type C4-dicarboxylate transport system substrate-binding protein